MAIDPLLEHYQKLRDPLSKIFVVPLIRYNQPDTSYLYNLYRSFLETSAENSYTPTVQSLSVFAHYRFVREQLSGKSIILHYHWLEFQDAKAAAGMIWKCICLQLYKLFGGKLIWTIHNKDPHRGRWLKTNFRLRRWMARQADSVHVHCQSVIPELSEYFGISSDKFFVHPHPLFPTQPMHRDEAIQHLNNTYENLELSPEKKIFLIFGNIARYKGIEKVISIFSRLSDSNNLLIAGRIKKGSLGYYKRLKREIEPHNHIKLLSRYIPDRQIPWFFNGSDYVIFNHKELIASGVIELARSYDKEIIAPRKGCLKEHYDHPKLNLFESYGELERLLRRAAVK